MSSTATKLATLRHALVNLHAYKSLLQAQPLPVVPSPAAHADDALRRVWDDAAQPWLPDPAALARPHWQMPQPFCGMSGQPPASDRPPLRPVSACSTPAAVTPPAHSSGVLNELQPDATAHDSAVVSANEHGHFHARSAGGLTAGMPNSSAPQPASGDTWQAQPAPSWPPVPTGHRAIRPEGSSAGHGLPACDAEHSAAVRRLMHQPSFAAWVPLDRLTGCEIAPMEVPVIDVSSPFCLGPPSTDQLSLGPALTAKYSGALGVPLAQQGSQDVWTPAAHQPQMGHPTQQQMEQPSCSQQPYQQMQLRQAGERGLLPPSGASLMGNEDSLCAFLGGWQGAGLAQQHKSGLGRHGEPRHAAGPSSISGPMPDSAAGGRLSAELPCSSQPQHPNAADEVQATAAQAVLPQKSPVAVPAQGDPGPRHESPAAATEMLKPQSEARTTASQPGVPPAAAAEQLMHAEGEDFWRSLLSVVKDYKGKCRPGQGCIRQHHGRPAAGFTRLLLVLTQSHPVPELVSTACAESTVAMVVQVRMPIWGHGCVEWQLRLPAKTWVRRGVLSMSRRRRSQRLRQPALLSRRQPSGVTKPQREHARGPKSSRVSQQSGAGSQPMTNAPASKVCSLCKSDCFSNGPMPAASTRHAGNLFLCQL